MSSALWPVTIFCTPSCCAPLSRACLLNTPQKVQLLVNPMTLTISSMVHPQSSLYERILSGNSQVFWLSLTVSSESSLQPVMPSSMESRNSSSPQSCFRFRSVMTWASTVESLPPDAAMATLSPRSNSLLEMIVQWISSSKASQKQGWQIRLPVFGRRMKALLVLQLQQSLGILVQNNQNQMQSTTFPVTLNVYDLSGGMAKMYSPMFLGKQINGIWHTGIVVYNKEYYFGGGICAGVPSQTPYGVPVEKLELGTTEITQDLFESFLQDISGKYSMEKYDLFENNCNNFSNECAEFLLGKPIPEHITGLPKEVLNTPIGQMFKPMIDQLSQRAMYDQSQQHFDPSNGPQHPHPQQPAPFNAATQQQQLINNIGGLLGGNFTQPQPQQQPPAQDNQPSNVIPIEDFEMFFAMIESSQKCVIDFYADWCGPCKTVKPVFNELSNQNADIQFYSINIDKAKELAQQLGVQSIPTFITYRNGVQSDRWTGGNPQTLKDKVQQLKNQQ